MSEQYGQWGMLGNPKRTKVWAHKEASNNPRAL
jgi:hypothetical protein